MTKIPEPKTTIATMIDAHHETRKDGTRWHMGASQLGHHCERFLWLNFRWAITERPPGRILRLFRRGQHEEEWVISDLRAIGLDVRDTQQRVHFGNQVSGSLDGIVHGGVPEAPKAKHVLEIKTHNLKSFKELLKDGLEKSKPQHWAQCQVYMLGTKIDRALYFAICKDDDAIYTERVKLDKAAAQKLVDKGKRLTMMERLPEPCINAGPDWYLCKFCPAYNFCHHNEGTTNTSCRTCAHVSTMPEGFHCSRWDADVPNESQPAGCPGHVFHPDLVPGWTLQDSDYALSATYLINGQLTINGEDGWASTELAANLDACLGAAPELLAVREVFGGRVTG